MKSLCGQGDLYVRLKRDFLVPQLSSSEYSSSDEEVERSMVTTTPTTMATASQTPQQTSKASNQLPQASSSILSPSSPGPSSVVDLTATSPQSNVSSGDDLPEVNIAKSPVPVPVTVSSLYTIFTPSVSEECVDCVVRLSIFDPVFAMNVLLQGTATGLLQLLRRKQFNQRGAKIVIDDEDILEEALLHYKHPSFDPTIPIRVSYKGQPAVDTGGVTRQFFTDVLSSFARQDSFQLFMGHSSRLRPAYSPQILPLMKILGTIIGHSLILEGPGFTFLAPFVFWYVATGSEQIALPYVSVHDLSPAAADVVTQVSLFA